MYASWLLSELGIPTGHERVFVPANWGNRLRIMQKHWQGPIGHDLDSWGSLVGDVSNGVPAYYGHLNLAWPVAHLVRHPYHVLVSWWLTGAYGMGNVHSARDDSIRWRKKFAPSIFEQKDEMGRCIEHIWAWGQLCDHPPEGGTIWERFRVEDLAAGSAGVSDFVQFLVPEDRPPISRVQIAEAQVKFGSITNSVHHWEPGKARVGSYDDILDRIFDHPLHWKIARLSNRWGYA